MMSIAGFETKRELKAAVGQAPAFIETSMFGAEYKGDGSYTVVGPTPERRKWYAMVKVADGVISQVS
jgi:hypothetical protein